MKNNWHQSQRGYFAGELYERMKTNDKLYLVVGDLGYGVFDKIRDDFPNRFLNVGAAEQAGVGICVGLAIEGYIPLFYTITSFFLRAAETIALYAHGEQLPIKLVGSGRDNDYLHDGPSHDGKIAQNYLKSLDIKQYYPESKEEVSDIIDDFLTNNKPGFISLRK